MLRSENRARVAYLEARRERCGGGYSELSPAQVAPLFERITGIPAAGFSEVRSGWWVRRVTEDLFHVLQFLRSTRGFDYRFRWGVSLGWVPRVSRPQLKWHRTLRSARFDLWDQAHDYLIQASTPWQEADVYFPDRSLGEECFAEDLAECWARVRGPVESWWSGVTSPEGVLERADEQSSRLWEGAGHAPTPELVAGFTLARLGRLEEARARLQRASEYPEAEQRLLKGLELVAANRAS